MIYTIHDYKKQYICVKLKSLCVKPKSLCVNKTVYV
jgi:hypothetical protein